MAKINVKLDKKAKEIVAKTANISGGDPVPTKGSYTINIYFYDQQGGSEYASDLKAIVDTPELSTFEDLVDYLGSKNYSTDSDNSLIAVGQFYNSSSLYHPYGLAVDVDSADAKKLAVYVYDSENAQYVENSGLTFTISFLEN